MENNDILSGFSAVFGEVGGKIDPSKLAGVDASFADFGDENFTGSADIDDNDGDDDLSGINGRLRNNHVAADVDDNDDDDDNDSGSDDDGSDVDGGDPAPGPDADPAISALFDAIAESAGWGDIDDESKPKDAESLVEYIKRVAEENSKPQYANDLIADLDEYVRNGGDINTYLSTVSGGMDYDNIDLSNENTQKMVLREFLAEKGFSDMQIRRKIEKYEDADILEDEAMDALESLRETKEERKKALLEEQKSNYQAMIQEQQNFYNNVIREIGALTDIRGISIPKQDKQALVDYIFKVESDGKTRYQKDYSKSTKNLIESAYFTMKGDSLITSAKKSGETSAVEKLKSTLNSTKVSGSKQRIENRSAQPLWSVASSHLRRPQ